MRRSRQVLAALALAATLMPMPALSDWLDEARAAFGAGDYATALALAAPRAETGDPAAQNILAVLHFHGLGMEMDRARGLDYYEAAAAQGHPIAMANLAWLLYEGTGGVPRDPDRARALAEASAAEGNAEAMNTLGVMAEHGAFGPPDHAAAAAHYRRAAEAGSADGMSNLGALYAQGLGVAQDDAEALRLFRQASEAGNGQGARNFGYFLELGRGGPRDIPGAIAAYRLALTRGHAAAANDLGFLLRDGAPGLAPDPVAAAEAFAEGVALGDDTAPVNLAWLLSDGVDSVPDDIPRAVGLYWLAYERGNAGALSDLAYMYWDGDGVEQDLPEARRLLQILADAGDPAALNDLGFMREMGFIDPMDLPGALELYEQAARMGYPLAGWGVATIYLNPAFDGADPVEGHAWCAWAIAREPDPSERESYATDCGTLPEDMSPETRAAVTARTEALLAEIAP